MKKKLLFFGTVLLLCTAQGQVRQGKWGGHFDFRLGGTPTSAMVDILWNSVLKNPWLGCRTENVATFSKTAWGLEGIDYGGLIIDGIDTVDVEYHKWWHPFGYSSSAVMSMRSVGYNVGYQWYVVPRRVRNNDSLYAAWLMKDFQRYCMGSSVNVGVKYERVGMHVNVGNMQGTYWMSNIVPSASFTLKMRRVGTFMLLTLINISKNINVNSDPWLYNDKNNEIESVRLTEMDSVWYLSGVSLDMTGGISYVKSVCSDIATNSGFRTSVGLMVSFYNPKVPFDNLGLKIETDWFDYFQLQDIQMNRNRLIFSMGVTL